MSSYGNLKVIFEATFQNFDVFNHLLIISVNLKNNDILHCWYYIHGADYDFTINEISKSEFIK